MTITATAPADAPTTTIKPGDKVRRLRNLDHPAWQRREKDPYDGGTVFKKVQGLDELIGESIAEAPNPRYHRAGVVLVSGLEYNAETGVQVGSSATRIEPVQL